MQESNCYSRVRLQQPLMTPEVLHQQLPLTSLAIKLIQQARIDASKIIQGLDDRLLVIVGPCSIHDPKSALEYASLLKEITTCYEKELLIIMRVYFEKPRTTVGWKGLISDPFLNGSFDINHGLKLARKLLLDITELGLPTATEFLDTIIPQYLSDLISWSAIGARTSESQIHRELASGLAMPVGFKNSTNGNIKTAIDAVNVALHPHHFISIDSKGIPIIVSTTGNNACHIVLRGSNTHSNYSAQHIQNAVLALQQANLIPKMMVDCSHGNSRKEYERQIIVAHSLANQIREGSQAICGVMLESNLVAGKQIQPLTYGQSITDGCISWKETVSVLEELANAVHLRRLTLSCTESAANLEQHN